MFHVKVVFKNRIFVAIFLFDFKTDKGNNILELL